jgi:hypothetical protein
LDNIWLAACEAIAIHVAVCVLCDLAALLFFPEELTTILKIFWYTQHWVLLEQASSPQSMPCLKSIFRFCFVSSSPPS